MRRVVRWWGFTILLLACGLTAAQVGLATLSGRGNTWEARYLSLCIWDGGWYTDIVTNGYRTDTRAREQTNLAFFPGYPVAAMGVARVFGLSPAAALLATSQLACVVFWCAVLALLRRWGTNPSVSFAVVALIFSYAGAFYLVVSYAESLFLAGLVILIACGSRAGRSLRYLAGAAIAGYIMSATRIVGAPLAVLPALWAWADLRVPPQAWPRFGTFLRRLWPHAVVSICTAFGTISFFIFCAARFGHWDQYFRARAAGWGVNEIDYGAMFQLKHLNVPVPRFANDFISPADISQIHVAILVIALFLLPILDLWFSRRGSLQNFHQRLPFYLAAWMLWFLGAAGTGLTRGYYVGFIRYGLLSHVLLVLAAAHAYRHSDRAERELPLPAQIAIFLVSAIGLALQLHFCSRFTHHVLVG